MADIIFKAEFHSDWHCGSGLAAGADVDLLVIKDKAGFPYIPGKTIKGLLRDEMQTLVDLEILKEEVLLSLFGDEPHNDNGSDGKCCFSNATLTKRIQDYLTPNNCGPTLFRSLASTAIEENGQAKEHSLRRMEVVVPLTLFGKISDIPKDHLETMKDILQLVKRLGTGRNRGLGRCTLTVEGGVA